MSMPITVSVIVPCFNEEATVRLLLDALVQQTYPLEAFEVIIADGRSTDHTRQVILEFQSSHPQLRVEIVDNPKRVIPSGLNRAIEAARGKYIIRLDAHAVPARDYIECSIAALEQKLGDNVGGVWTIKPARDTWIARSIAVAAAHPLGVGDALYRIGAKAQLVDTVPFGAFRRTLAVQLGMFDENLLTNEDYEFNTRIRNTGGKIWLEPAIKSTYFARSTLAALAKQYFRYGYWKAQMLKRYPKTLRWRQAIPPLFAGSLIVLFLAGFFHWYAWIFLAGEIALYTLTLITAGLHIALKNKSLGYMFGLPLAIATMHITWGIALLWGIIHPAYHHSNMKK